MIRNAVLHPIGEQPMLADLFTSPNPSDVSLLCTNLRTIDGKRPRSIDEPDALFIIPLATIRFVEVPSHEVAEATAALARNGNGAGASVDRLGAPTNGHARHALPTADDDLAPADDAALVPIPGQELYSVLRDPDEPIQLDAGRAADAGEEPDEDLLRRIRDV